MDDFDKAMMIYKESGETDTSALLALAEKRNPDGLYMMGNHCKKSDDPPLSPCMAYKWYYLAVAAGHKEARMKMIKLESKMTGAEVEEAIQNACCWAKKHPHP